MTRRPGVIERRICEGWTDQRIRERYEATPAEIRAKRAELRIHARPSPDWDWRAAQAEIDAGRSMREAAEVAGATYHQVTRACYTGRLIMATLPSASLRTAGEMLDGGASQREVGVMLGCSDSQVTRMLQDGRIQAPEYRARVQALRQRTAEVNRRLLAGEGRRSIADDLGISINTVHDRAGKLRKRGAL